MSILGEYPAPVSYATETMSARWLYLLEVTATEDGILDVGNLWGMNRDSTGQRVSDVTFLVYNSDGTFRTRTFLDYEKLPRGTTYWRQSYSYYPFSKYGDDTILVGETYYLGVYIVRYPFDNRNYSFAAGRDMIITDKCWEIYEPEYLVGFDPNDLSPYTAGKFTINVEYTPANLGGGAASKIEGITPGKLEQTPWGDIEDLN